MDLDLDLKQTPRSDRQGLPGSRHGRNLERRDSGVYFQPFSNPLGTTRVLPYRLSAAQTSVAICGRSVRSWHEMDLGAVAAACEFASQVTKGTCRASARAR